MGAEARRIGPREPSDPAVWSLKGQPSSPAAISIPAPVPHEADERPRMLACAACGRPIASTADRVAVGGAHEHTFTNPHGYRYHIGCFARADGCVPAGEPTDYFTWFPPYMWQIDYCVSCLEHLGWLFRREGEGFHALVLERLVEIEQDPTA